MNMEIKPGKYKRVKCPFEGEASFTGQIVEVTSIIGSYVNFNKKSKKGILVRNVSQSERAFLNNFKPIVLENR